MRQFFGLIFFLIYLNGYSQDSAENITLGIGGGLLYYPEGKLYGFTHNYHFDYLFSNHFGTKLSLDFGEGQSNGKYYFDFSKSAMIGVGLIYAPLKKLRNFNVNTSFTISKNIRILGTKDEIINGNYALSKFTSYEKLTMYGLTVGIQYPIVRKEHFLFAAKIDSWASWLKIDAMSAKLLVGYIF